MRGENYKIRKLVLRKRLFIVGLAILPFSSFAQFDDLEFDKITTKNGLSHSTVYDITQDKNHHMWFATREGVNKYDGYRVKTYYKNNEGNLPSNVITKLVTYKDNILLGTENGMAFYNDQTDLFEPLGNSNIKTGRVNDLYSSEYGLYIAAQSGLYLLNEKQAIRRIINNRNVKSCIALSPNKILSVYNRKVHLIDSTGKRQKLYPLIRENEILVRNFVINTLFKDTNRNLWLGTTTGVFLKKENEEVFKFFTPLDKQVVRSIRETSKGDLLFGSESGLFILDGKNKEIKKHIGQSFGSSNTSLSDKSVRSLYISKDNFLWVGTYFGGVNLADLNQKTFHTFRPRDLEESLAGKAISGITEDRQQKLWFASEDAGISIYDPVTKSFDFLTKKDGLSSNNIHALLTDEDGKIWIGAFLGGLHRYDPVSGVLEVFERFAESGDRNVFTLHKDSSGRLLVGTGHGIYEFNYQTKSFHPFLEEQLRQEFIYDVVEDTQNRLWICTIRSGIFLYDPAIDYIDHYTMASTENDLTSDNIIDGYRDRKGNLWFGTLEGGLQHWNADTKSFSSWGKPDGLPNATVYGIIEDDQGSIWCSTNKGISKFDPRGETFINFTTRDGLAANQHNFQSGYKAGNGSLYFGSVNGITYFDPAKVEKNNNPSPLVISSLLLFNEEVIPGNKSQNILVKPINETSSIELKHNQNVVTFNYHSVNYKSLGNNDYAYYLENFEDDYHPVGNKTSATYTNLKPGEYTFKVKNIDDNAHREIAVTILPPFWMTTPAYLLYFLSFVALVWIYSRFLRFVHQQKHKVEVANLQKTHLEEINKNKIDFFTFISHEFKTPLTLIIASVDSYFKKISYTKEKTIELSTIKNSAHKLHHLISQLMQFRKIETNHAQIEHKHGDIVLFIKETFEAFHTLFEKKSIVHDFQFNVNEQICYFDADKIEMVVTNLVSNAIKNTSEGGIISMSGRITFVTEEEYEMKLTISDTGVGMSQEKISKIFMPFYKDGAEKKAESSGIGLALVNSLIQFLNGRIKVDSEVGKGSKFILSIPLKLSIRQEGEIKVVDGNKNRSFIIESVTYDELVEKEGIELNSINNPSMLIVEDNKELLAFLSTHFSPAFKVMKAQNGLEAMAKLEKRQPDIIISDVKMPKMNGLEFAEKLKTSVEHKHIPLLLLTASGKEMDKVQSLKLYVNAYMEKPFNLEELDLVVRNLLEAGKNLEERFASIYDINENPAPENNQDKEFLRKFAEIVKNNFMDTTLSVEKIAREMGVSRGLLHMKIKKIANTNPSEFLKKIRLKEAIFLMRSGKSISEASYMVGYNDPNYYGKVFKKEFGMSPTKYLQTLENERKKEEPVTDRQNDYNQLIALD